MAFSPSKIQATTSLQTYADGPLPSSCFPLNSVGDEDSYTDLDRSVPGPLTDFRPSARRSGSLSSDAGSTHGANSRPNSLSNHQHSFSNTGPLTSSTDVGSTLEPKDGHLFPVAATSPVTILEAKTDYSKVELDQNADSIKETKLPPPKRRRKRLVAAFSILALLITAGIVIGIVFGIRATKGNRSSKKTNDNGTITEQEDPSVFPKDSRLKDSFYGITYTPMDCNQGLAATIEDVQLLSQLTSRIRLHHSECNQPSLTLQAINQTQVNMKVFAAIGVAKGDAEDSYQRQKSALRTALEDYGTGNIEGIAIELESLFDYPNNRGIPFIPESDSGFTDFMHEKILDIT